MRPARILLLIVAIVAGGLAAFLATRGNGPAPRQTAQVQTVKEARTKILVASAPIGVGQRLSPKVLEWQEWPEGAVRPEYVTIQDVPDAEDKLTGAVARFEFFTGEPIREAKLAHTDAGYLSAVLSPGMRAVSVYVDAGSGAGGMIVPNDQVDVVLTRKTSSGEQSQTIIYNAKVMAIGHAIGEVGETSGNDESEPNPKKQTFSKKTTATLELDPGQAETIINAASVGKLTLVLRSVADFARQAEVANANNHASVKMIRYGRSVNVITGSNGFASGGDAAGGADAAGDQSAFEPPDPGDSFDASGDAGGIVVPQ